MEMSRNGDTVEGEDLQDFFISRRKQSCFVRGKFLSSTDISSTLTARKSHLNDGGRKMLEMLGQVKFHHFQHTQVSFPVSNLQHIADLTSMCDIYKQEGFKALGLECRDEFEDLSFWSPSLSSDDIGRGYQQMLENVKGLLSPEMVTRYEGKVKEQFANSSAFSQSSSPYGNFKFSFPLSDLLSLYKDQCCRSSEPQLRVLGTDIYKTELVHYVLVHSPDTENFKDLPIVPSCDQSNDDPLPTFYKEKGTLYWRPESTSSALKLKITKQGSVINECHLACDFFITNGYCRHIDEGVYCTWDRLILAFHLPDGFVLKVPNQQLLENLTECDAEEPYWGRVRVETEVARKTIQGFKDDFRRSRRQ